LYNRLIHKGLFHDNSNQVVVFWGSYPNGAKVPRAQFASTHILSMSYHFSRCLCTIESCRMTDKCPVSLRSTVPIEPMFYTVIIYDQSIIRFGPKYGFPAKRSWSFLAGLKDSRAAGCQRCMKLNSRGRLTLAGLSITAELCCRTHPGDIHSQSTATRAFQCPHNRGRQSRLCRVGRDKWGRSAIALFHNMDMSGISGPGGHDMTCRDSPFRLPGR